MRLSRSFPASGGWSIRFQTFEKFPAWGKQNAACMPPAAIALQVPAASSELISCVVGRSPCDHSTMQMVWCTHWPAPLAPLARRFHVRDTGLLFFSHTLHPEHSVYTHRALSAVKVVLSYFIDLRRIQTTFIDPFEHSTVCKKHQHLRHP
jgi:hypothetical protein